MACLYYVMHMSSLIPFLYVSLLVCLQACCVAETYTRGVQVGRCRGRTMSTTQATAATVEKVSALKKYRASELSTADLLALTARPRIDFTSILETVHAHILSVQLYLQLCGSAGAAPLCLVTRHPNLQPHVLLMAAWAGEAHCGGRAGAGRCSSEGVHSKV